MTVAPMRLSGFSYHILHQVIMAENHTIRLSKLQETIDPNPLYKSLKMLRRIKAVTFSVQEGHTKVSATPSAIEQWEGAISN